MIGIFYSLMGLSLAGQEPLFRLVGLYDASGVLATSERVEQRFLWKPSSQMINSCGPSKSPDGLGVFEAEAVGNQMSPALAVVLEYTDLPEYQTLDGQPCSAQEDGVCEPVERPSIASSDITVGIGVNQVEFQLQPMVLPRYLSINIDGYVEPLKKTPDFQAPTGIFDTTRYQKLIRTQLEIELCLEHKVGRGWLGNDEKRLRQAFLLDPPDLSHLDRKYFGGQRDPVPSFLGPSDACVTSSVDMPKDETASKGKGDLQLTPSDIWGSSLRNCDSNLEQPGLPLSRVPSTIPLQLSQNGIRQARSGLPKWKGLDIQVTATGPKETDVYIDVKLNGEPVEGLENVALFPKEGAMLDILARLQHHYPRVGSKLDADRYVVLMIPNWQIVEGLRRMYSRSCIDDTADLLCKCEVRNLAAALPKGEVNTQLDMLDKRLSCKDIDGNVCQLSREKQGEEATPAEMCLA